MGRAPFGGEMQAQRVLVSGVGSGIDLTDAKYGSNRRAVGSGGGQLLLTAFAFVEHGRYTNPRRCPVRVDKLPICYITYR
jgi:hypothetical protein